MERRSALTLIGGAAGAAVFGASTVTNEKDTPDPDRSDQRDSPKPNRDEEEPIRRGEIARELAGAGAHDLLTNEELGELLV